MALGGAFILPVDVKPRENRPFRRCHRSVKSDPEAIPFNQLQSRTSTASQRIPFAALVFEARPSAFALGGMKPLEMTAEHHCATAKYGTAYIPLAMW